MRSYKTLPSAKRTRSFVTDRISISASCSQFRIARGGEKEKTSAL